MAFGIASGYLAGLLHAMRLAEMRVVINLHESAAGCAAAGYAMASGKLGVVYAHSGPGVTNALTGLASAYLDSVPLMLIAAQSPIAQYGRDAHQEATGATTCIDQLAALRPAAGAIFRPPDGKAAIRLLRRAIATSLGDRTSTVIEIATDVLTSRVPFEDLAPEQYRAHSAAVDLAGIEQLAAMLRAARAPVLLVGHEAIHRGLTADLLALCEEQDLPCATVDYAKGAIAEDHPLSLGVLGSCGHQSVTAYFQQSDLIISLGARLGTVTSFNFNESLFQHLVQIDENVGEIGRNFRVKLGIVSDVVAAVRALRVALGAHRGKRNSVDTVRRLRDEFAVYVPWPANRPKTSTAWALSALREVLPRETLVVGDSGLTLQYLKHFFPVYSPDGFYCLYGLAAMGAGMPLAVGIQVARPDAVVMCVIGDGGALVHLSELAVAAQNNLPIIFVVVNNGSYKQVSDRMERYQSGSYGCKLPTVDFAAVATGCGVDGYHANDPDSVSRATRTALTRRRPALIEIAVDGDNLFDITSKQILAFLDKAYSRADQTEKAPDVWPFPKS